MRAVGQPDDGRSRVGQLDVVMLAVGGKPFEGVVGTDMEYPHQDALGLFDKASGADGSGDGLAGGPVRFNLNCSGEVQDEPVDERQLPVTVQHALPRRQDSPFTPACVEETMIIGEKTSATAHILKDFPARRPVVRMHVLHKNTHRGHHLAALIAVDLVNLLGPLQLPRGHIVAKGPGEAVLGSQRAGIGLQRLQLRHGRACLPGPPAGALSRDTVSTS